MDPPPRAGQSNSVESPIVLLVGPTGVGKTRVSLALAPRINAEIISADSRLFYRGMDIGTAKPSREERLKVPHHLIDIADPDEPLSLAGFQERFRQALHGIEGRGRWPLVVGGTGQYVAAIRSNWRPPAVPPNEELRRILSELGTARGGRWLHDRLAALDPEAAGRIDSRNLRRTVRALEVILLTGRRFSSQRGAGESEHRLITIGLRRDREKLYQRIDQRIEEMMAGGLLEETRSLLQKGYSAGLPAFSAIGYAECVQVLGGKIDLDEARVRMRRASRALVRRQANWFKDGDSSIHWFDAARPDLVDAIATLVLDAAPDGRRPAASGDERR